jgi:hypothetical protein
MSYVNEPGISPDEFSERFLAKGRELYEAGDKSEMLYCLSHCIRNDRPIPDWLKQAFENAQDDVRMYKVKSLDDVFGKPLAKGKRLTTERRKMEIAGQVFRRVRALHEAGKPIDKSLFSKVGREFGVGGTIASELYYEVGHALIETEEDFINRKPLPERKKKSRKSSGKI